MPLLQVEKIIKSFGGLMALWEVNFEISSGGDIWCHRPQWVRQNHSL